MNASLYTKKLAEIKGLCGDEFTISETYVDTNRKIFIVSDSQDHHREFDNYLSALLFVTTDIADDFSEPEVAEEIPEQFVSVFAELSQSFSISRGRWRK